MNLFTMGFTRKSAEEFFTLIGENHIEILIDIRLRNNTQFAGFTKSNDLAYFLKAICACRYVHEDAFAPNKELLDDYKKQVTSWEKYESIYRSLYLKREMGERFRKNYQRYNRVLLLCSEPTPEKCHRRLLAEYIGQDMENIQIIHL